MKVQTKVLLLLGLITALFVGGLIEFRRSEQEKLRRVAAERAEQRERDFTKFLEQRQDRLNVLVEDCSVWDAMVQALRKKDAEWAAPNLRDETLTTYEANAVWM